MRKPKDHIDELKLDVISNSLESYGDRVCFLVPEEYVGCDEHGEYVLSARSQNYLRDRQKYRVKRLVDGRPTVEFFFSRGD